MTAGRRKVLAALETVTKYVNRVKAGTLDADGRGLRAEMTKALQQAHGITLAVLSDEHVPVSLFKAWACRRRFRQWELQGRITIARRNGKLCCRPSEFFRLWSELGDDQPRSLPPRG